MIIILIMTIDDIHGGAPAHPRRRARALSERVRVIISAIDDNNNNDNDH